LGGKKETAGGEGAVKKPSKVGKILVPWGGGGCEVKAICKADQKSN